MLGDAERRHLVEAVYPQALAAAGEPDTRRNRLIAASDYWLFLRAGGGSDAQAAEAIMRGLRSCERAR